MDGEFYIMIILKYIQFVFSFDMTEFLDAVLDLERKKLDDYFYRLFISW